MISLVTATYGRVKEVDRLLDSLSKQTCKNFELILVDQNEHNLLKGIVEKYEHVFPIKYIRSAKKGLSYNRNIGLKECRGDIVGFPDDDCIYDNSVVQTVYNFFMSNMGTKIVATKVNDIDSGLSFINTDNYYFSRKNVLKYCISYNVFIRLKNIILFDEKMGVGAYWGSGEETDYLWELMSLTENGAFISNVAISHPKNSSSKNIRRAYSYGLGFGALFKKEILYRKHLGYNSLFVYHLIRTVGGCVIGPNRSFYYHTLLGRIKGFYLY